MFIEVINLDKNGFVAGAEIVKSSGFSESEYIKYPWNGYFIKPKWDFSLNKWIETYNEKEGA
ncbi:hypothetical protein MX629_11425 [Carnobacterium divergens]|uniref:Uncharacterized protein n=1 Tax=Carnobacterium divergens TaxID=2748 RepID=A0AAW8RBV5_CARDV|nr:hypothetical protein [Carnobacterium divergens]MDT1959040.1 hypothetical protein [Carnobacterium divergens]MDT1975149.1 hypothetical protein [Carnobacterium divergens]